MSTVLVPAIEKVAAFIVDFAVSCFEKTLHGCGDGSSAKNNSQLQYKKMNQIPLNPPTQNVITGAERQAEPAVHPVESVLRKVCIGNDDDRSNTIKV